MLVDQGVRLLAELNYLRIIINNLNYSRLNSFFDSVLELVHLCIYLQDTGRLLRQTYWLTVNAKDCNLGPLIFHQWKQFRVSLPVLLGLIALKTQEQMWLCGLSNINLKGETELEKDRDGHRISFRLVAWSISMSCNCKDHLKRNIMLITVLMSC